MNVKCEICKKEFSTFPYLLKIGRGRFCSKNCRAKSPLSKETLNKLKLSKLGKNNPMFGKKLSEEHRAKISKTLKPLCVGRKIKNPFSWTGKKFSEEHKNNIRKSHLREKCYLWRGGRMKHAGYILILKPEHPFCNASGYVREHRLIMENNIGRYLLPEEVVHHDNKIKDDNRIENLVLFSSESEHQKYHGRNK